MGNQTSKSKANETIDDFISGKDQFGQYLKIQYHKRQTLADIVRDFPSVILDEQYYSWLFAFNTIESIGKLSSLPQKLKDTTLHVRRLDLRYNKVNLFGTKENDLQYFQNVEILNLRNNCLLTKSVGKGISSLSKLIELDISNNLMAEILSPHICSLTNLRVLDLRGNVLQSLSNQIGNLNQLEELLLDNNQLSELPSEMNQLTHLKQLSLRGNFNLGRSSDSMISVINHFQTLEYLSLGAINLSNFSESSILALPILKILDISSNGIGEFPSALLSQVPFLEILDARNNSFEKISCKYLNQMPKLRKVNLSLNKISEFVDSPLNLPEIQLFSIANNVICGNILKSIADQNERPLTTQEALSFINGDSSENQNSDQKILEDSHWTPCGQLPKEFFTINEEIARNLKEKSTIRVEHNYSRTKEELIDKIVGIIYGNAIGDAIGLSTEFLTKENAHFHYDREELSQIFANRQQHPKKESNSNQMKEFLQDRHRSNWLTGDWTDDTDQMILILQSLIDNHGELGNGQDFARKLLKWVNHGFPELGDSAGFGCGRSTYSILQHESFRTDAQLAARSVWESTGKTNAPNGAVMRTSILGIPHFYNLGKVVENTKNIALTTHADPRCVASSVAVTTAIALILQGKLNGIQDEEQKNQLIDTVLNIAKKELESEDQMIELEQYIRNPSLEFLSLDKGNAIGYTYKTLGAGFYSLCSDRNFKEAILVITMEGGDADTNAAVAGALLGAKLGYSGLPKDWVEGLIHSDWLNIKIKQMLALMGLI